MLITTNKSLFELALCRRFDERLDVLEGDWYDSVMRGDTLRAKSVDSATFILEGGDVARDDDALVVDDSAVDNLRDDLCSGHSANACVLTCLCEVYFLFLLKIL